MGKWVAIPWVRGKIPWVGGRYTMSRGSIYHRYGVQKAMGRWVDIPWVGRSKYHG